MLASAALAVSCLSILTALFAGLTYRRFWELAWGPAAYRVCVTMSGLFLALGFSLLVASRHA